MLYKTRLGYELRLVGKNEAFARYGGIKTKRLIIYSVMISGALAGLGGIVEILGVHGTYKDNFSANLGFDGIIIALLARNNPVAVVIAALFYAYLQVGGQIMQAESDVSRELAVIIQVLLVLFVSAKPYLTTSSSVPFSSTHSLMQPKGEKGPCGLMYGLKSQI